MSLKFKKWISARSSFKLKCWHRQEKQVFSIHRELILFTKLVVSYVVFSLKLNWCPYVHRPKRSATLKIFSYKPRCLTVHLSVCLLCCPMGRHMGLPLKISRGLTLRNQCPESKTPLSQGRRVPMISFALHFTYLKAVENISLHLNFSRFLQKWHPILPYKIIHTSINDILKQCMIFL